jgi:hypothetical protein
MFVRLFDVEKDKVVLTEQCYLLKDLKAIMTKFPDEGIHMKIYQYVFNMTCPDPNINAFATMKDEDKEELICQQADIDFSLDHEEIVAAVELCKKLYDTPTVRAYNGIKSMLDKLSTFMYDTEITTGRDGNGTFMIAAAEKYDKIRQSYKGAYKDMMDELGPRTRGDANKAYDQ